MIFPPRQTWRARLRHALLVVSAIAAAPSQAGAARERIRQSGHFVFAYRLASVPFSYVDPDGHPVGYAIDLCGHLVEAIGRHLGRARLETNYVSVTSANRTLALPMPYLLRDFWRYPTDWVPR
jgi:hypothetical protein